MSAISHGCCISRMKEAELRTSELSLLMLDRHAGINVFTPGYLTVLNRGAVLSVVVGSLL